MNSSGIFQYNEIYNTGIPVIDEQHLQLIDMLNDLVDSLRQKYDGINTLQSIAKDLKSYAHYHFDTEIKIWHKFFPNDDIENNQIKEHGVFIEMVQKLFLELDKNPKKNDVILMEYIVFLVRWFVSHILLEDRFAAKVALALQSGTDIKEAKITAQANLKEDRKMLIDNILNTVDSNVMSLIRKRKKAKDIYDEILYGKLMNLPSPDSIDEEFDEAVMFVKIRNRMLITVLSILLESKT